MRIKTERVRRGLRAVHAMAYEDVEDAVNERPDGHARLREWTPRQLQEIRDALAWLSEQMATPPGFRQRKVK